MSTLKLPTVEQIQAALKPLDYPAIQRLSVLSGVSSSALWNIRQGIAKNPGVDTVRKFVVHIQKAKTT